MSRSRRRALSPEARRRIAAAVEFVAQDSHVGIVAAAGLVLMTAAKIMQRAAAE